MSILSTIKACTIIFLIIILTIYISILFFFNTDYTFCEKDIIQTFILMLGFSIAKITIIDNLFSTLLLTITEGIMLYSILEINETYGCSLERYSDLPSFSWTLVITIMWIDSIFVSISSLIIVISNCYNSCRENSQRRVDPYVVANRYGMYGVEKKKLLAGSFKFSDELEGECSICLIAFSEGDELLKLPSCDHLFHLSCLNNWINKHSTCPYCRTTIEVEMQERTF